jgi:hypothetical protein
MVRLEKDGELKPRGITKKVCGMSDLEKIDTKERSQLQ